MPRISSRRPVGKDHQSGDTGRASPAIPHPAYEVLSSTPDLGLIYMSLTEEFNRTAVNVVLSSGQAVVFHRLAIMSKDGDWIIRETTEACDSVLEILAAKGARYRLCAPLSVDWLHGGWPSHFEFTSTQGHRVRCDFFSRLPQHPDLQAVFDRYAGDEHHAVVGLEDLAIIKRTDRLKDHAVIGELARRIPPEREIEFSLDPDRIIELAPKFGMRSRRPSVLAALAGADRRAVRIALSDETDEWTLLAAVNRKSYRDAAGRYFQEFVRARISDMPLYEAHSRAIELARHLLPQRP